MLGKLMGATILLLVSAAPSHAGASRCEFLGSGSSAISMSLLGFSRTWERDALDWSAKDYDDMIALARGCNGASLSNGTKVKATDWESDLSYARTLVLPVAMMTRQVMDEVASDPTSFVTLPDCRKLGTYRVDVSSGVDNARSLIGRDLVSVPVSDAPKFERHLGACRQVLEEMMKVANSASIDLKGPYESVILLAERYRYVRQAMSVWDLSRRSDDLVVTRDGVAIPPTMASDGVRQIVGFYDKWKGRLEDDETVLSRMLTMIEGVRQSKLSGIDSLYLDAVSKKVNERIFGR